VTGNQSTLNAILRRGGLGEHKVYDNVLVEATSSDPDAAAGFRGVLWVFDSLGKPADQVKLPPEETPCERAGIDPDGGGKKEGTCKLGQQTLTVVNRGSTLKIPEPCAHPADRRPERLRRDDQLRPVAPARAPRARAP
jgi:hypothetical protein